MSNKRYTEEFKIDAVRQIVEHVSGIRCKPCDRNAPKTVWRRERDLLAPSLALAPAGSLRCAARVQIGSPADLSNPIASR